MIEVTLKESGQPLVDLSEKIKAAIEINEQLDASLDSGTISYLTTEADGNGLNEALAKYSIRFVEENNGTVNEVMGLEFVGMDSRALLHRDLTYKTVTNTSAVTRESLGGGRYLFTASGEIDVSNGENLTILSVKGDVLAASPTAKYQDNKITWKVQWLGRVEFYPSYTVTIVYCFGPYIYSHQIALTEPSKLLQGIMIDGFGVTQPEKYEDRKTLEAVVTILLQITPFDKTATIFLTSDASVRRALKVKSPEFKWNTQTTLWECLVQVGAVIDAMPRFISVNGNTGFVTFDFLNAYVDEVDSIDDGRTNVFGENVNESQYNTALSAIVENLRENE